MCCLYLWLRRLNTLYPITSARSNANSDTKNILNTRNGDYERVFEYIPIGQPNAGTLSKIDELRASKDTSGDGQLTLGLFVTSLRMFIHWSPF